VSAFIVLGVGLLCALIARALIMAAAFRVSWRWGIGVMLPFGPMAFRRKYPEDARRARPFQLATLPCLLLYFLLGPGMGASIISRPFSQKTPAPAPMPATGYALEKPRPSDKNNSGFALFRSDPTIEQRRVANAHEFERLASKDKELKLRKRDLLRSDVEGNTSYARDLAEYNADLAKANAEKNELAEPAQ
jgi:hypothetical protein